MIRAKLFCDGWLSPMSSAQSYIFHPREITLPIFSVQTNDKYLNDKEIGLFANNNSKEDKKTHDWRRPVTIEFFPVGSDNSAFNQLGETRIQGGQSRSNALKSMVFYANKRFDPDYKRYSYEFFPDQRPGITEFKSFSLRDGGNDFGDLYFRDLIIQRTMAGHVDLDWQAGHSAVLYINGEYMGMLNIRERSNEDNIYSNYNDLEDIDMVEISHEQVGGVDQFIEEFKGSEDATFYNAFKAFYSEKGHTKEATTSFSGAPTTMTQSRACLKSGVSSSRIPTSDSDSTVVRTTTTPSICSIILPIIPMTTGHSQSPQPVLSRTCWKTRTFWICSSTNAAFTWVTS